MNEHVSLSLPRVIRPVEPSGDALIPPLQSHAWPSVRERIAAEWRSILNADEFIERSHPRPVIFRWEPPAGEPNHARYDLLLSRSPDFQDAIVLSGIESTHAEAINLMVGARYYWKVIQRREGVPAVESPVASFVTHPAPPRWILVPGIPNVRDLGGWSVGDHHRVRQGLIYRSAELNTHTVLPPEGERVLIEELNIRTDLDLRGTAEDESPAPALDLARVNWAPCPLYAYRDIFTPEGKESVRRAFQVLADPDRYPVLIHCWAGADRTGTLAFLINGMLGVSLPDLIHDYELTSLSRIGLRLDKGFGLDDILNGLKAFGEAGAPLQKQIETYLQEAGVPREALERMRQSLIEPFEG